MVLIDDGMGMTMPQVTLDSDLAQVIAQFVSEGEFRTASDVVRAGLRLLDQERRAELRAELAARLADGKPMVPADEVFARLRAHHADAVAKDRGAA